MRFITLLVFGVVSLYGVDQANAYTPKTFVQRALEASFVLKDASFNERIKREKMQYQTSWKNPIVTLNLDDRLYDSLDYTYISLRQQLPAWGLSSAQQQENKEALNGERIVSSLKRLNVTYQALSLYVTLYNMQSESKILKEQIKEVDKLLSLANKRQEVGENSILVATRIDVSKIKLDLKLKDTDVKLETLQSLAKQLLQLDKDLSISKDIEHKDVLNQSDSLHLALFESKIKEQKARYEKEQAKSILMPSVAVYNEREMMGTEINTIVGFSISYPLPLVNRNKDNIQKSQIKLQKVKMAKQQQVDSNERQFKRLRTQYTKQKQQLADYKDKVLSKAKLLYDTHLLLFKSGENSLLELLDAQTLYYDAQIRHNQMLLDTKKAYLKLAQAAYIDPFKEES